MSSYSAADIEVLTPLQAVRRRPGMYVGDVRDGSGLHHLLWEALANALDEHLAGHGDAIAIELHEGGAASVEDRGRGIPVEGEVGGTPVLERVLTEPHFGATFDGHRPHVHVGAHGVGLFALNALSAWLEVEIYRGGKHCRQRYERGRPRAPLALVGATERQGTRLTFAPDPAIFSAPEFDATLVAARLRELAFLCPGLELSFADGRRPRFRGGRGAADHVAFLNRARRPRHDVVAGRGAQGPLAVDIALQWAEQGAPQIEGFVNLERAAGAGTNSEGLERALVGLFCALTGARPPRAPRRRRRLVEAMSKGLAAVVYVTHHDPRFEGPTRAKLTNPEVALAVAEVAGLALRRFCAERPDEAAAIVEGARAALA